MECTITLFIQFSVYNNRAEFLSWIEKRVIFYTEGLRSYVYFTFI